MRGVIRQLKRRVLRRTEERLRRYGRIRGQYGSKKIGYCLVGAVRVETRWPHLYPLRQSVYSDLLRCAGERSRSFDLVRTNLEIWHDRWTTDDQAVYDALQCARGEEMSR